jgi:hypothetical protein
MLKHKIKPFYCLNLKTHRVLNEITNLQLLNFTHVSTCSDTLSDAGDTSLIPSLYDVVSITEAVQRGMRYCGMNQKDESQYRPLLWGAILLSPARTEKDHERTRQEKFLGNSNRVPPHYKKLVYRYEVTSHAQGRWTEGRTCPSHVPVSMAPCH